MGKQLMHIILALGYGADHLRNVYWCSGVLVLVSYV